MKSRLFLFVSLLVLVSLAIVACGGGASVTPGTAAQPEAKANPGQLVVYSGRSESLVQPLIDQFIAETGINVDVRYAGSPELAGVLLEEGANSPADLFFAQDPGSLGAIDSAGMLQPLPESILAVVPDRFRADDGDWVGISGRARVIVYNTQAITDPASQLPDDIYDFIAPEWNGRIGWAPTNASYQTMVTAMRHIWGEEKTRAWLEGILANNPIVFESNTPIVDAVGSG
ncbi:MAG TPA: extracellular solute-binding protein, partial [Promineifilum sp.]|nr:extracellular solute-binding protein [Promineifilum sp.]